jgi:hypothetical protein
MGLFKDLKNMKDTVHAAPDMIRPAQTLGAQAQAQAQALSLERYAQLAKAIGERHLDQSGIEDLARSQGLTPEAWQQAYDGWNARMGTPA